MDKIRCLQWALQKCSPHWCFGFARKASLSTIFLIIKIHLLNKTNLDAHNNLYSFCFRHYNHVLLIGIYNIDALDLQEKLCFQPFSLQLLLIHEMKQTWILVIISIVFGMGTIIMFTSLGYTILMLQIYKKSFAFHHFPCNYCSSMK